MPDKWIISTTLYLAPVTGLILKDCFVRELTELPRLQWRVGEQQLCFAFKVKLCSTLSYYTMPFSKSIHGFIGLLRDISANTNTQTKSTKP